MQLDDGKEKINYDSWGVVLSDVAMKVVDVNTGEIFGPYQEGELHFQAKGIMKCYFQNPKATKDAIDSDDKIKEIFFKFIFFNPNQFLEHKT